MARTTPDLVRSALDDADASDVTDNDLSFEIESASDLIDKWLAPYTTEDLTMTETFVAAHYFVSDPAGDTAGKIKSERHLSAKVDYDTSGDDDAGSSYWERAKMHDPTGRLGKKLGSFEVI